MAREREMKKDRNRDIEKQIKRGKERDRKKRRAGERQTALTSDPPHHLPPSSDAPEKRVLQQQLGLLGLLKSLGAHLVTALLPLTHTHTERETNTH